MKCEFKFLKPIHSSITAISLIILEILLVNSVICANLSCFTSSSSSSNVCSCELFDDSRMTKSFVLKITGTNCEKIPNFQDYDKVHFVESLISHNNPFKDINSSIFNEMPKLKMAVISRSEIKSLPKETFGRSKNLEIIILSYNKIAIVDSGAFLGLEKLKQISLKGNQLSTFPADIANGLSKLESINLSWNKLPANVVKEFLNRSKDSRDNQKIKYLNFYKNDRVCIVLTSKNQKEYIVHDDSSLALSLDEIVYKIFFGQW